MRVLVLGAGGMLGRDLVAAAPAHVDLAAPLRAALDLVDTAAVESWLDRSRPTCVINAAAYTDVDAAEDDERAREVNGAAVARLAASCAARGIHLAHFSSDYVFRGDSSRPYREHDVRGPLNAYGHAKHEGEVGIERSGAHALIVRTQWLFGLHGRSFARTMWQRARAGQVTRVVADQWGRPTYTRDLAMWTWRLLLDHAHGTVHAANDGIASWYEVAHRVFARAGAEALLSPCSTTDYPGRAVRPAYSVLDIDELRARVGAVPPWTDALDRFMDELSAE